MCLFQNKLRLNCYGLKENVVQMELTSLSCLDSVAQSAVQTFREASLKILIYLDSRGIPIWISSEPLHRCALQSYQQMPMFYHLHQRWGRDLELPETHTDITNKETK